MFYVFVNRYIYYRNIIECKNIIILDEKKIVDTVRTVVEPLYAYAALTLVRVTYDFKRFLTTKGLSS